MATHAAPPRQVVGGMEDFGAEGEWSDEYDECTANDIRLEVGAGAGAG